VESGTKRKPLVRTYRYNSVRNTLYVKIHKYDNDGIYGGYIYPTKQTCPTVYAARETGKIWSACGQNEIQHTELIINKHTSNYTDNFTVYFSMYHSQ